MKDLDPARPTRLALVVRCEDLFQDAPVLQTAIVRGVNFLFLWFEIWNLHVLPQEILECSICTGDGQSKRAEQSWNGEIKQNREAVNKRAKLKRMYTRALWGWGKHHKHSPTLTLWTSPVQLKTSPSYTYIVPISWCWLAKLNNLSIKSAKASVCI